MLKQHPPILSIIVDGTKDITGVEQESICVRYVNEDLIPIEAFLKFYSAEDTKGMYVCLLLLNNTIN